MKKKTILILTSIAVIIVPFITSWDSFSDYTMQALIFMPMRMLYNFIIYIGSSSDVFGNIMAWSILIIMSVLPLLLIYKFKRSLLNEKGIVFVFLSLLSLTLSIFYFGNHFKINHLGSEVVSNLAFYMSASMWYFSYLVILYESYLRKYKGADEAMRILSIALGLAITFLVLDFSLAFVKGLSFLDYNFDSVSIFDFFPAGTSDLFNALFYSIKRILLIRLLWIFNEALLLPVSDWISPSFIEVLSKIKRSSKHLLSFAIYYPILHIVVRFMGMSRSLDPNFMVNFPFFEILLALIIIVISEIIIYAIGYKEDSESFV